MMQITEIVMPEEVNSEETPVSLGGGVQRYGSAPSPKKAEESRSDIYRDDKGNEFILSDLGDKKWSNIPQTKNQLEKEGMYAYGAPEARVFNISTDEGLKEYNELLAETGPSGKNMDGDPKVIIIQIKDRFHEGNFYVYALYRKVWYLMPGRSKSN